jgi:outer membrane protein TolC
LAEKNYYPDFDVGISYGQRDNSPDQERTDFLTGSVTIKLPFWYKSKESRKVEEKKANIRKTVEQHNALKNDIYFQIREVMTEIEKYDKEIELFQTGLIPQSKLSLESAIAGYKVNKVDFLTLVNNQITLYSYKLDYYRALTDHEVKLAELETTIGKRLF